MVIEVVAKVVPILIGLAARAVMVFWVFAGAVDMTFWVVAMLQWVFTRVVALVF